MIERREMFTIIFFFPCYEESVLRGPNRGNEKMGKIPRNDRSDFVETIARSTFLPPLLSSWRARRFPFLVRVIRPLQK